MKTFDHIYMKIEVHWWRLEETFLDSGALSVASESLRLVKGPSAWESEDSAGTTAGGVSSFLTAGS